MHPKTGRAPYPRSSFTAFADILALRCADLPEPLTPLTAWLRNRGRNTPAHHLPQLIAHLRQLQAMPAWQDFDVILTPMLSTAPPPPGSFSALSPAENFAAQTAWTPWATLWNLTGWAGITVPLIPTADCPGRWPIAVHLGAVGQRISEAELISLAEWLQQQFQTMLQSPAPHRSLCLDDVTLSEPGSIQIPQIY